MSVAVHNAFAALAESSDDENPSQSKQQKKATTTTTNSAAAPANRRAPPPGSGTAADQQKQASAGDVGRGGRGRGGPRNMDSRGSPSGRGRGRGGFRGGRGGGRFEGEGGGMRPQPEKTWEDGAAGDDFTADRREGRNFRNERTRQRGVGETRHREFDRHISAQGRGRGGVKKGGGGAHNWGNAPADFGGAPIEGVEASAVTGWDEEKAPVTAAASAEGAVLEGDEVPAEETAPEEKPAKNEPVTIGYDEYLKQLAAKRSNLPSLPSNKSAVATTQRSDLEREGFVLHVKETDADSKAATGVDHSQRKQTRGGGGGDPLGDELRQSIGSHRPRSGGRGRGRGNHNDDADDGERRERKQPQRPPPKLGDKQAFPDLG